MEQMAVRTESRFQPRKFSGLPQVRHGESVLWRTVIERRAFSAKHTPSYKGRLSLRKGEGEGEGCSQRVVAPGARTPHLSPLPLAKGRGEKTAWDPEPADTTDLTVLA